MEQDLTIEMMFRRLLDGTSSPEEVDLLMALLSEQELESSLAQVIQSQLATPVSADQVPPLVRDRLHQHLQQILATGQEALSTKPQALSTDQLTLTTKLQAPVTALPAPRPPRSPILRPLLRWTAAALLLLAGTGSYFAFFRKAAPITPIGPTTTTTRNDITPGGNKAILTLSGGQQIILDSAANGTLAQQGRSLVQKHNGQLTYTTGSPEGDPEKNLAFNTLTTPRGGQYQLTLPDGTKVWLDAESSITYPTAFTGNTREVDITGQAYLKVAHKQHNPFKVRANGTETTDLGTEFNVNAYKDEGITRITLIEGAVSVRKGKTNLTLLPGEQIATLDKDHLQKITAADINEVIAWKNGIFHFNHATLSTVLQQLARWYNVQVGYEGKPPAMTFSGELGRNLTLSQLLKLIGKTGLHFKIENQKLTIIGE